MQLTKIGLFCWRSHFEAHCFPPLDPVSNSFQLLWMFGMPKSGAFGLGRSSPTAELSNTVAITDAKWNWPVVDQQVVSVLSEFGEIARLDTSLVTVAGCLLVTFFDVRCAQRLMLSGIAQVKPFPPAAHDCRTVRVNMLAFAERVGEAGGGFSQPFA